MGWNRHKSDTVKSDHRNCFDLENRVKIGGYQEWPEENLGCRIHKNHVDEIQRDRDYNHADRMNLWIYNRSEVGAHVFMLWMMDAKKKVHYVRNVRNAALRHQALHDHNKETRDG